MFIDTRWDSVLGFTADAIMNEVRDNMLSKDSHAWILHTQAPLLWLEQCFLYVKCEI